MSEGRDADTSNDSHDELLARLSWVRALARELVRDAQGAEDVAQEAALVSLERRGAPPRALGSWLRGVVRRLSALAHREGERRVRREQLAAAPESQPATVDVVAKLALHRRLVDAVESLDEPSRSAILLRFYDGLPPRAIAAKLGVPIATVKTRLARGLEKLRARLVGGRGGDRRALAVLLAPICPAGAAVLGIKGKVALAALAAAGLLIAFEPILGRRSTIGSDTPPETAGQATAASPEDAREESTLPIAERERLAVADRTRPASTLDRFKGLLRGRVVDANSRSVEGARVEIARNDDMGQPTFGRVVMTSDRVVRSTSTSAEGEFEFPVALHDGHDLVAIAGRRRVSSSGRYAGEEIVLQLADSAALRGSVTTATDGRPVVGALVHLDLDQSPPQECVTDSDGRYAMRDVEPTQGYLAAFSPSGVTRQRIRIDLHPGEETTQDVVFGFGGLLGGRVVDAASGAPIAGAELSLDVEPRCAIRTDEQGRYRWTGLDLVGLSMVRVRAAGYGGADVWLQLGKSTEVEHDFRLSRGRRARGRVVDEKGHPLAEVEVVAYARGLGMGGEKKDRVATSTTADGSFEFADLRREMDHFLLLRREDLVPRTFAFPDDESDRDEVDLGDLTLDRGGCITGSVKFQGELSRGCLVFLLGLNEDWTRLASTPPDDRLDFTSGSVAQRFTTSDSRGLYHFSGVPAGDYDVVARWPRESEARANVKVRGRDTIVADLHGRSMTSISGVVARFGGGPVDRVVVRARREIGAEVVELTPFSGIEVHRTDADADGRFRLDGLAPGDYTLVVTSANGPFVYPQIRAFAPKALRGVAAGTRDLRIELDDASPLRIRATEADGSAARVVVISVLVPDLDPLYLSDFYAEQGLPFAVPGHTSLTIEARRCRPDPNERAERPSLHRPPDVVRTGVFAEEGEVTLTLPPPPAGE